MIDPSIFRNYDIRGEYGTELTEDAVHRIAHAFVQFAHPKTVAVGMDARTSSPALKEQMIRGLVERGVTVIDIGLVSTDASYFAAWKYGFDGSVMITASHMPKQFNGLKFLRLNESKKLAPIGMGLGMEELRDLALAENVVSLSQTPGTVQTKDIWDDFVAFNHSFASVQNIKPLKVVMDAGNGMGGVVAEKVFAGLPLDITKLFFEADGTFPNHPPNPIIPENRVAIIEKVKEIGADLGIAWDADCDRVYFIDEKGAFVNGDFVTALLGLHFVERNPGAVIVYDVRASRVVKESIEKAGGIVYMERVGHTYIKHKMMQVHAIFGGEISGHYYFAENQNMECGFAPAIIIMEKMSVTGKPLSEIIAELGQYHISGEINFKVEESKDVIFERIQNTFSDAQMQTLDGLSVEYPDWRFNLRPSANDPVIRLNMEASSYPKLQEKLAQVETLVGGERE